MLLKLLGLDFESRIANLKHGDPASAQEGEEIKETFKGQLLQLIQSEGDGSKGKGRILEQLLNYLTGQQLWSQSGNKESAYILWQIPLNYNGQLEEAKVAVETARKGSKLDVNHCHIGVSVNTDYLGEVGIDAWFFEQTLSVRILTQYPDKVESLLLNEQEAVEAGFQELGFRLGPIKVTEYKEDKTQFLDFMTGRSKSGVDYRT